MAPQEKKQCSRHGCWNDAASHRARFCKACFKTNAAAAGKRRGLVCKTVCQKWPKKTRMYGLQKKCSRHGCRNDVHGSRWAGICLACVNRSMSAAKARLQARLKGTQQCSRYGCRNDAVSLRARFCTACFKKNAAAVGRLRGNPEKVQRKCSRHGCRNDVQGSRWARLCPACFKKNQGKVTKAAGKRSALLSHQAARWALALKNFLKYRGIRVVNTKQGGKIHVVLT